MRMEVLCQGSGGRTEIGKEKGAEAERGGGEAEITVGRGKDIGRMRKGGGGGEGADRAPEKERGAKDCQGLVCD